MNSTGAFVATIVASLLILSAPALAEGETLGRSFGIGMRIGTATSTNGGWSAGRSMPDAVRTGPDLNVAVEKWVTDHFEVELEAKLAWMSFREGAFPERVEHASFTVPALLFSNSYFFSMNRLRPFVAAGAGLYAWKINTGGPLGGVYRTGGERFEKMSYGLHGGLGAEYIVSRQASVLVEARYHFIFSQDRFVFGSEFTEQGMLTMSVGVSGYFSTPGP
jgi:hypothetical protein